MKRIVTIIFTIKVLKCCTWKINISYSITSAPWSISFAPIIIVCPAIVIKFSSRSASVTYVIVIACPVNAAVCTSEDLVLTLNTLIDDWGAVKVPVSIVVDQSHSAGLAVRSHTHIIWSCGDIVGKSSDLSHVVAVWVASSCKFMVKCIGYTRAVRTTIWIKAVVLDWSVTKMFIASVFKEVISESIKAIVTVKTFIVAFKTVSNGVRA